MSCGLLPWQRARHRFLPTAEDLDDAYEPAATGTWFPQREWGNLWLRFLRAHLFRGLDAEQRTAFGEVCFANTAGQQAVVPDAMESVGQDVHQDASNELRRGQAYNLLAIAVLDAVVLPAEHHRVGVCANKAMVGDRHSMGVAAEISEHGFRPVEGRFAMHHPFGFAERGQPCRVGTRLHQITEEGEITSPA